MERVITRTETEDEYDSKITSTISVIYFTLPANYVGPTTIKCRAELFDLFNEASITRIQPRIPSSSRNVEEPNSLQHSSAQS